MKISAVIIAFNEAKNIEDAIRSVEWADEILVIDSGSTDNTRTIAKDLGAKVIEKEWLGFARQKQFAIDQTAFDRILSLDADERVTPELKAEILSIKGSESILDGYSIPRLSIYMGREIRHCGWYPDRQLRFFDRRKGRWTETVVHESFELEEDATKGQLKSDLLHFSVESPEHHNRMIAERYAPLGAGQMFEDGKRTSLTKAVFSSWFTFIRTYFLKFGFLDGKAGFAISYFAAHNVFVKHLILLEIQKATDLPS